MAAKTRLAVDADRDRPRRVLVCGGRNFGDLASLRGDRKHPAWARREAEYTFVLRTLDRILHPPESITDDMATWLPKGVTIISGMARGVDSVAVDWAVVNWAQCEEYPIEKADWDRLGNAAGPIRNQRMLDEGKPDLVIAFPGGNGTLDMVTRARKAKVKIEVVFYP